MSVATVRQDQAVHYGRSFCLVLFPVSDLSCVMNCGDVLICQSVSKCLLSPSVHSIFLIQDRHLVLPNGLQAHCWFDVERIGFQYCCRV